MESDEWSGKDGYVQAEFKLAHRAGHVNKRNKLRGHFVGKKISKINILFKKNKIKFCVFKFLLFAVLLDLKFI